MDATAVVLEAAAVRALQSLSFANAVFLCERLLAVDPGSDRAAYLLARAQYLGGSPQAAVRTLEPACLQHGPSALLYGQCCADLGRLGDAEAVLAKLVGRHADDTQAPAPAAALGSQPSALGSLASQQPFASLQASQAPPSGQGHSAPGGEATGGVEGLSPPTEAAAGLDLDWASVFTLLGSVRRRSGRNEQAAKAYAKALELDPFNWAAFTALCDLGMQPDATRMFEKAGMLRRWASHLRPSRAAPARRADEADEAHTATSSVPSARTKTSRPGTARKLRTTETRSGRQAALRTESGLSAGPGSALRTLGSVNRKRTRDGNIPSAVPLSQQSQQSQQSTQILLSQQSQASSVRAEDSDQRAAKLLSLASQSVPSTVSTGVSGSLVSVPAAHHTTAPSTLESIKNEIENAISRVSELLANFGSAYLCLAQYNCRQAIDWLNLLPTEHFNTAHALGMMAQAHFELTDYAKAEIYFERVRHMQPARMEGMDIYGTCLWHLKKPVELSFLGKELEAINRLAPQTWCVIGNYFSLKESHAQAISAFGRAVQLDPEFFYAHTLLGHEYLNENKSEEAATSFRTALRLNNRHYNALFGLSEIYLRQEQFKLADYHIRRAIQINGTNPILLSSAASIAQKDPERCEEALQMFRAAVRISANALPFRMGLAQALFDMEMYDEAVMEAREIAHIHPDAKIHFLLGKALMRLGRNNEALMALTLAHDNSKNAATIKELIDSISNEVEEDIGVPDPFAE